MSRIEDVGVAHEIALEINESDLMGYYKLGFADLDTIIEIYYVSYYLGKSAWLNEGGESPERE